MTAGVPSPRSMWVADSVRLTETFLSSRFTVVRADVSQFGDPEIVQLSPGEPLPFDTGSFDLTLGLEVIEHLPPPARPGLIRELQRIARRATIVSLSSRHARDDQGRA